MKKIISVLFLAVIILTMCACSEQLTAALVISGTPINAEIFTYYADKVASRPADYGLGKKPSADEIKRSTVELCKKYIATNTEFRDMGISLSAAEKTAISQNVNDLWLRFENHYNKIGVSKQTLTKIQTAKAYEDKVFTVSYDKGTGDAAGESKLKDYFYENYVSFHTVCAYFTSADGKSQMPQQQKNDLVADLNSAASIMYNSVDDFITAMQEKNYSVSDSLIIKRESDGYPDGFFEKVYEQKSGTVQIIEYDECVFAVFKEDLKSKGDGVYANYRSACINDLYAADYDAKLDEYISTLEVEEKSVVVSLLMNKVK